MVKNDSLMQMECSVTGLQEYIAEVKELASLLQQADQLIQGLKVRTISISLGPKMRHSS